MNQDRDIDRYLGVAYTKEELLEKIEALRSTSTMNNHIYLFSKDISEYASLKWDSDISLHTPGKVMEKIKSLFGKEASIESSLTKLNLKESERVKFLEVLEDGGTIIVSGFDPFNNGRSLENPEERRDVPPSDGSNLTAAATFNRPTNTGQEIDDKEPLFPDGPDEVQPGKYRDKDDLTYNDVDDLTYDETEVTIPDEKEFEYGEQVDEFVYEDVADEIQTGDYNAPEDPAYDNDDISGPPIHKKANNN